MRHATAVSLTTTALVLAALGALDGAMLLLALPFVLYLVAGLLVEPPPLQVSVTRALSHDRLPVGEPLTVTLTLVNRGPALAELLVVDAVPPGLVVQDDPAEWLLPLPAGAERTLRYTVTGKRGAYQFTTLHLTARNALGLRSRARALPVAGDCLIYPVPRSRAIKYVDIRPRRTRVYSGTIAAQVGGDGTDFFGVRGYQHGDPLRRINWRASARPNDALFTNEFEQERVADVGIILDARKISNLPRRHESLLDYSVNAAALLADALINQGNRLALLTYGALIDYTLPGYGKLQREKIIHALARARLGDNQVFAELTNLPTRLFPPRSQIILVSPLLEADLPFLHRVRALGFQLLIVAPNPISYQLLQADDTSAVRFGARIAHLERQLLIDRLLQAGIQVIDWDVGLPFDEVAGAYVRAALTGSVRGALPAGAGA